MSDFTQHQHFSAQVQRVLTCIEFISGHEIDGVEPKELAHALDTSSSDVTRILKNLEYAGWAERLPANDKRWRLHKKPVQICNTVEENFKQRLRSLDTEARNYRLIN